MVKNLVGLILQMIKSRLRKGGSQSYIVLSPPVQAPLSPSPDGLGGSRVSCAFPHRLHAAQVRHVGLVTLGLGDSDLGVSCALHADCDSGSLSTRCWWHIHLTSGSYVLCSPGWP